MLLPPLMGCPEQGCQLGQLGQPVPSQDRWGPAGQPQGSLEVGFMPRGLGCMQVTKNPLGICQLVKEVF